MQTPYLETPLILQCILGCFTPSVKAELTKFGSHPTHTHCWASPRWQIWEFTSEKDNSEKALLHSWKEKSQMKILKQRAWKINSVPYRGSMCHKRRWSWLGIGKLTRRSAAWSMPAPAANLKTSHSHRVCRPQVDLCGGPLWSIQYQQAGTSNSSIQK